MSIQSQTPLQQHPYQPDTSNPAGANMADEQQQRGSGGSSGRSSSGRTRQNPQQQLSTIEKSVTHLLVATKQLLETLTMWSRGTATETEVSDVYVRLGYEFNIACRAFNAIGVDTADLGPVPDLLRTILEDTLSQEASQASLDKFLPRIRDIIINLLHGLKKKQQRLRQKGSGSSGSVASDGRAARQASTASNMSMESNLTQQLEDVPSRASSSRTYPQRSESAELGGVDLPPRTTSVPSGRSPPRRQHVSPQNSIHHAPSQREDSNSSVSSMAMQNIPVIAPYPETDTIPTNEGYQPQLSPSPEPPRPPPKQNDALTALQRGGELERRASRRFSAYQISKHLGTSVNGVGTIPPPQHSPVPNRGRDVRESMNAVRSRGSMLQSRARSRGERKGNYDPSPSRLREERRISEEAPQVADASSFISPPSQTEYPDDEIVKTPEDKLGHYPFPDQTENDGPSATINGPISEPFGPDGSFSTSSPPSSIPDRRKSTLPQQSASRRQAQVQTPPPTQVFVPDGSPQSGKELTLFLQYKSKIKKYVLPDGGDLNYGRLQLAFIDKFAWNTHSRGELPEIYIQDPVSGVRHELEDMSDIRERSVLVLNVEALDEVKRHIDDGLGGLRRIVEGIRTSVESQNGAIQRVSERQQESAKELASIVAAPPPRESTPTQTVGRLMSSRDKTGQLSEIQKLRRDLAVVRQTYSSFVSDMNASMTDIRSKAASVKTTAAKASIPDMDSGTGRAYVNNGKKSLSNDSENIVNRVDDLQDIVEDLRKDVVTRGVRPLPRQLETVSKDISTATADLKKMQEYLKREKPVWTKIWEKELQVVCDDRDLLTMQEELAADLEDDLEKAAATFALVEQATKQQNLQNPNGVPGTSSRSSSRTLNQVVLGLGADPQKAKDGVLGEVRALQPNHESRLEAIERAEKNRQRELESRRGGEFQLELGKFVEQEKLKKSGGVAEVERVRLIKEEQARRANFETLQRREQERAERAAAQAAAAANGEAEPLDEAGGLEVPDVPADGLSSPEAEFVEAKEDVTPSNEVPR